MVSHGPRARRPGSARVLRLLLLAIVAIGLAPGTFLRTPTGQRSDVAEVTVTPLTNRDGVSGMLPLTGVWELASSHGWFGGFSALVARGEAGLVAGTDRGFLLDLDLSGPAPRAVPGSFRFVGISGPARREFVDLESLAHDPSTGTLWAGFEGRESFIMRLAPDGSRHRRAPAEMAAWSVNSGPETMTRLGDGRFLVIAEGAQRSGERLHEALLFPGDPVEEGRPLVSRFRASEGYDPVDAAPLPDGRLLILLRRVRYSLPATFDTAVAIADTGAIREGSAWEARIIARLTGGIFADNFEGLAFVASGEDPSRGSIWLIADDNFSIFQRSLLVRFDWDPRAASPAP